MNTDKSRRCPGSLGMKTPELSLKSCPDCSFEIEIVSDEVSAECPRCRNTIYNSLQSCVQWCHYARDCVGDEIVQRFTSIED